MGHRQLVNQSHSKSAHYVPNAVMHGFNHVFPILKSLGLKKCFQISVIRCCK